MAGGDGLMTDALVGFPGLRWTAFRFACGFPNPVQYFILSVFFFMEEIIIHDYINLRE